MYYRTEDFKRSLLIYTGSISVYLGTSFNEGNLWLKDEPLARVLSVGLASIASIGVFCVISEVTLVKILRAHLLQEKISFDLLPSLFLLAGVFSHLYFYKLRLDNDDAFRWDDPIVRSYLIFSLLTVFSATLYINNSKQIKRRESQQYI